MPPLSTSILPAAAAEPVTSRPQRAILPAVLFLTPLLLAPGLFFYFDVTPKVVVLLTGAAAVLWFGWSERVTASPPARWLVLLLAAQAASLIISTLISTNPALSVAGTNWRRFGLIVQIALLIYTYGLVRAGAAIEHLLAAIAAGGVLAGFYGIAQYFGWDPWNPPQAYHVGEGIWTIVRPPGTLGHAGYFSVYLLHAAAAGLALAWTASTTWLRRLGVAAAALDVAAILLSGTRGALVGLAAALFVLAWRRGPFASPRRMWAVGAAVLGLVAFYYSPPGQLLRARTRWYVEDAQGGGRLTLWTDTLRMGASRWLFGYGPETFSSQYPRFESETLARQFPDRYFESPHNIFLDAFAAQGLPGLLVLLLFTGLGLVALSRTASRPLGDALGAGVFAALVASQFVAFTAPTALFFYATAAIAVLASTDAGAQPVPALPEPLRRPLAVALTVAAFSFAWTDFWLARTRVALESSQVGQALQDYQRLRRWRWPGLDTDLWYSRALMAAAPGTPVVWQQALAAAIEATRRSEERPNAYYNLAAFHAVQNDFAGTEQSLRSAIEWAPNWYKSHWMLAQVLQQAGRLPEAAAEARRAAELDGGQHPEVAATREAFQQE